MENLFTIIDMGEVAAQGGERYIALINGNHFRVADETGSLPNIEEAAKEMLLAVHQEEAAAANDNTKGVG